MHQGNRSITSHSTTTVVVVAVAHGNCCSHAQELCNFVHLSIRGKDCCNHCHSWKWRLLEIGSDMTNSKITRPTYILPSWCLLTYKLKWLYPFCDTWWLLTYKLKWRLYVSGIVWMFPQSVTTVLTTTLLTILHSSGSIVGISHHCFYQSSSVFIILDCTQQNPLTPIMQICKGK